MSELPVDTLLTVDQAIAILDAVALEPRVIQSPLMDALGHRLAEDIFSDRDYPPFDKAVMDGFAVRSADALSSGVSLNVIETIAAGQSSDRPMSPGEAVAIMTGAPLPAGADAVIPVEQTSRDGNRVTLKIAVKPNQAIARRGSDTPDNRLLLAKGTILGPAQIGVAATVGKSKIAIYAAPSVALLATGDELIPIDQIPTGAQIRNSNNFMMQALLQKLGCKVIELGVAKDNPDTIRTAIQTGLQHDTLFITGGMSMGEHDYVPGLLRELGLTLHISKLRIKPGKPFAFALGKHPNAVAKNPAMVFGLPGNPLSAYVCTLVLANRILTRLTGGTPDSQVNLCKTLTGLPANGPRQSYVPAVRSGEAVQILPSNGSADLFTLGLANALIVRDENMPTTPIGNLVNVINLP
jgi:molybdopterin molybdotransferase